MGFENATSVLIDDKGHKIKTGELYYLDEVDKNPICLNCYANLINGFAKLFSIKENKKQ
jgi:hypothetical protein